MIVYYIFISLFFISAIFEVNGLKKRQTKYLLLALTIILVLFVGLRFHTGSDEMSYIRIFERVLSRDDSGRYEYGYIFLNKLFKYMFNNYYVLQFAITGFFCLAFYRFVHRHSIYPILSFTFLILFFFFNILTAQVRQSIAIAIIIMSTNYIFDRKILPFLSLVALASLFHISAIFAIPLYFFYKNYGKIILVLIIGISQIFYFHPEIILSFFESIVPYLPEKLSTMSIMYLYSDLHGGKAEFNTGLYYIAITLLSTFVVLYKTTEDKKTSFFINALVMYLVIRALHNGITIIGRMESYYLIYAIIAYNYLFEIRIAKIKAIYACCMLLFFCFPYIKAFASENIVEHLGKPVHSLYVPYYNVLYYPWEATQRFN